ncbi:major facilitator superfamily domain-containing protein [Cyathus striatus]|nr:major facilitator superfamily domain-containing protein [Cyathus striatus]
MTSERSPLLSSAEIPEEIPEEDDPYARFSPSQKSFILAQLSWCGLLPFFVSGTFVPSIPQIAEDVSADPATVGIAVGISIAATALGGFCAASYTSIYGRRQIFLATLPVVVLGSFGVALSQNAVQLLFWRFIQSLASSSGRVIGPVVIGDIYKVEERGLAYGVFLSVSLLGCAVAPPLDGIIAYYSSWRITQCLIGILELIAFISMAIFLPETKWNAKKNNDTSSASKYLIVRLWQGVWLLRSPVLSLTAFASATALLTDYALLVPFAYTIATKYNITNESIIGACFIPIGLGNILAAPLTGRLSDKIILRNRQIRKMWYPEDRLYIALIGSLLPVPLSIVISGFITTYVDGWMGLALNLICFLVNGIGVSMSTAPATAYSVDVIQSRSADSVAATWGLRSLAVSLAISWVIPSINKFGVLATNVGIGVGAWVGAGIYYLVIQYGDELRACVDVGYSEGG